MNFKYVWNFLIDTRCSRVTIRLKVHFGPFNIKSIDLLLTITRFAKSKCCHGRPKTLVIMSDISPDMANVQSNCNLIGREEYVIDRIVIQAPILCSFIKKQQHWSALFRKNRNYLFKINKWFFVKNHFLYIIDELLIID